MKDYGFRQISTLARETGDTTHHAGLTYEGVSHEKLAFENSGSIKIKEPGYVYIWLSNENATPVEVFFDDFKVTQIKSPVIQTSDYYAFGGEYNGYQRENNLKNDFKYNSRELQDELGLELYDYGARFFDPWGRPGFISIDPHAENYYSTSPYVYALNNPVLLKDDNGKDIIITNLSESQQKQLAQFAGTKEGNAFLSQFAVQGKEYNIGGEKFTFKVKQSSNHDIYYRTSELGSGRGLTETWVYNPTKGWVKAEDFSGDSNGARRMATNKAGQFYKFQVTIDDDLSADQALYTMGHESFVHVDQNKKELDQGVEDYKNGKDAEIAKSSPLKGTTPENVLSGVISAVAHGPTDHKLMVNGKVTKLENFVKELNSLFKTTKFSDELNKDKKILKANPDK